MMPSKTSINIFIIILSFSFSSFSHEPVSSASAFKRLPLLSTDTRTTDIDDQPTTTSILSLTLHPRSSVIKPTHDMKYSDLVLSRLASDRARARLINSNIKRAISPNSNILHYYIKTLVSPSLGGYVARIGVGQPVKEYYLLLDTGSPITWLQCLPCKQCIQQPDPVFDPSGSSSYSPLSCESRQCGALGKDSKMCNDSTDTCMYKAEYGVGSFSIGEFVTETVSFGSSGSIDKLPIGCGHIIQGFGGAEGILALGGTEIGFPSLIKATSFSYCLVDMDSNSSSTLEFNSAPPSDSVLVPLIINPSMKFAFAYYVELTGITIDEELVSIPESVYKIDGNGSGGIVVDSGTTFTLLPTEVYNSVRDTFVKYSKNLPPSSGDSNLNLDTCYDLSSTPITKNGFPTMSFEFSGGKTLPLRPENYLFRVDRNGKFCLAFMPSSLSVSIFGNNQLQGIRVTYDLAINMYAFSPDKC